MLASMRGGSYEGGNTEYEDRAEEMEEASANVLTDLLLQVR